MSPRGLVVAAPASGHGKTTVALGLLRALLRRGVRVQAFKTGPDFIDPGFLAAASGGAARNLDPWSMRPKTLRGLLATAREAEIVVVEGVTGLFDGAVDGTGSTADLAADLGLPVLLVVDARGMGASVAALVAGFRHHRPEVDVAGVILNRVGGPRHEAILGRALAEIAPVLGCLPRAERPALPSRHLGLVQAVEHGASLEDVLEATADVVEERLDLDALLALARPLALDGAEPAAPLPPLGQRVAVARDEAFAFAYPALLDGWSRLGATVLPFSPLADEPPAPSADAVFLPGGYPELHAGRLAAAGRFLAGLRAAAAKGAAVYGECGGYMVLGESLTDREGRPWPVAGLLPVATSFAEPRLHLGYREVATLAPTPFGVAGARFRGHEFHYASETARRGPPLIEAWGADGEAFGPQGCIVGRVAGSFVHLVDRRWAAPLAKPERRA